MGYVTSALVSGEQVLYQGHFHWMQKGAAFVLCFVAIGIFWVIYMWTTEMAVTSRRLIYKRGWIARRTDEISLNRIEEVNLQQSMFGRILSYGKVQVQGMGGSDIVLPTMGSPMRFKRELQEAQVRAERRIA